MDHTALLAAFVLFGDCIANVCGDTNPIRRPDPHDTRLLPPDSYSGAEVNSKISLPLSYLTMMWESPVEYHAF